jgi:YHS domain-containing protein
MNRADRRPDDRPWRAGLERRTSGLASPAGSITVMSTTPASTDRPRDPVCGMAVRIDVATEDGLLAEHDSHTYYFCRSGCRDEFTANPTGFITSHHDSESTPGSEAPIEIDAGMRLWYESCSCCLSDAHPEVKAALDAEREAQAAPPVDPGICEVAEAAH